MKLKSLIEDILKENNEDPLVKLLRGNGYNLTEKNVWSKTGSKSKIEIDGDNVYITINNGSKQIVPNIIGDTRAKLITAMFTDSVLRSK